MKISTLLVAALLLGSATHVMAQSESKGDLKFENVIQKGAAQTATPMAVTSDGNVVVTGVQVKGTSLGSFVAMASSKLDATPTWKVDITGGSSIVNAIVSDNAGGVFIGGDFNDKISLGGKTLEGKSSGSYNKTNAFVAHINKEGKVVAANFFRPTINPDMVKAFDTYQDGDKVYCKLNSLTFANGELYAGMIFTDILTSEEGKITSGNWNLSSMGWGVGSDADFIAAKLNQETLKAKSFPIVFGGPGTYTDTQYMGFDVKTAKLIGDGKTLYLALTFGGYSSKGVLKVNGTEKENVTVKYAGGINAVYLASVDMESNGFVSKTYDGEYAWVSGSSSLVEPGVSSLTIDDSNLYVGGSFIQNLPFNKDVKAVGNTDLFFASVSKSDFSLNKAVTSGYNEKTAGDDNEEKFSGYTIDGNNLTVYGAVTSKTDAYSSTVTASTPLLFTADLSSATALTAGSATDYTTGVVSSADGKATYYAYLNEAQTDLSYKYVGEVTSGIHRVNADSKAKEIYSLQGVKLSAPQKGLNIIGGKVVLVK